jgi:hypothetical protein
MEKPDLEKMEIHCGRGHHPTLMVLVRSLDWIGKAYYKCTVCGKEKVVAWRPLTKRLEIEDRD